jgi:hypothetical protein
MEEFKIGDFIKLKNVLKHQIDRLTSGDINVFKIESIDYEYVQVEDCNEKLQLSDIEPIPINGIDDINIYYDPIMCAPYVGKNGKEPLINTDYSYYFDAFKRCFIEDNNFQELVHKKNLTFVHEVQHFLTNESIDNRLMINKHLWNN